MPLTGGYRMTPVLQLGADVFCDSQCIARALEERIPGPTLCPGDSDGLVWAVGRWTDGPLFRTALEIVFGAGHRRMPPEFIADRGPIYFGADWAMERLEAGLADSVARLRAQLGWVEERLTAGQRFLPGDAPGLLDALVYFVVWFLRGRWRDGPDFLEQFPMLCGWERRVAAIGHGDATAVSAPEALAAAAAVEPETVPTPDPGDPRGLKPGDPVAVTAEGGGASVEGFVLSLRRHEVAIIREDERVGRVAVHFPAVGYRVERR